MLQRLIEPNQKKSFFLFGARGTGKSTFLRQWFSDRSNLWIDLLDPNTEELYATDPGRLEREIDGYDWVIIDEIQKLPRLLDVVHRLIESTTERRTPRKLGRSNTFEQSETLSGTYPAVSGVRFALTGSSARKLKAGHANMLAGRAFVNHLFPLTHLELGHQFDLEKTLQWGSLPGLLSLDDDQSKQDFLRSYAQTYLKEEVWAEQLVRRLELFRKFLPVAAQANGKIVVYSEIARDVGCDIKTVQSYFSILEDTLLGLMLQPYRTSIRKAISGKPKFYFFDLGVQRALSRLLTVPVRPQTSHYGEVFEHFVMLEFHRLNDYFKKDFEFSYLRTKDDSEIDLVIERPGAPLALIEIKSSSQLRPEKLRKFLVLSADIPNSQSYILSQDPTPQQFGHAKALRWDEGLAEIFGLGTGEGF